MSEKETIFLETFKDKVKVFKNNEIATIEEVVMRVCYLYLVSEKESDKEESAWLISKLNLKCKKQALDYMDFDEVFLNHVKNRIKKIQKVTRLGQKRRHQKREDFSLTPEQWEEACNFFDYKCAYCNGDKKLTYDHFIPFSKGGSFGQENIIPCCSSCNSSKNNKNFDEWFRSQSFYSEDKERLITGYINSKLREAAFL